MMLATAILATLLATSMARPAVEADAPQCYMVSNKVIGAGTNIGPVLHVPDHTGCCAKCIGCVQQPLE
jgi:hypothetical protein